MTSAISAPIFRFATRSDLDTIGRLGALLMQEHYDFDPKRFIKPPDDSPEGYGKYLGTQLANPNALVLVAERDGELLGYTYSGLEGLDYMSLRGAGGIVYDIVIEPAHRGRGVGALLLEATLAALKARGAPQVVLSTAQRNESAQRLFEHAGFRRTMIEMTKEL